MTSSATLQVTHRPMPLARKLQLVCTSLIALMVVAAVVCWLLLARLSDDAQLVQKSNVPQLQLIADLELNVTRTSLQLRHAILARDKTEQQTALDDIAQKIRLLQSEMTQLGAGMQDTAGASAFAAMPDLLKAFVQEGSRNLELIVAGDKEAAFAYLTEKTIPARNRLLAPLATEKERQGKLLSAAIGDIHALSRLNLSLLLGVFAVLSAALLGLMWYLSGVMRQLGADPQELNLVADHIATGDLTGEIVVKPGDQHSVMHALSDMRDQLAHAVGVVRHGAEGVANASNEIAQGNLHLSERTESQASALEQTAASMEELSATVRLNADAAKTANQLANHAAELVARGSQVMQEVVQTMQNMDASSHKIADLLGLIDGIAFQTNILALNAAVEASHAGEQGRGFAVVAAEVRALAQHSATAAKDIKQLVTESLERAQQGTQLVGQAGTTMHDIQTTIEQVSQLMGEISAASQEQSQGVAQVGEAVAQIDQAMQQNAALVEEMSAAAAALDGQAGELLNEVTNFRLDSDVQRAISAPKTTG